MTVYVVARLRFTVKERYDATRHASGRYSGRFNSRLLAADAQPQVLEGGWERDKIVIMSFPDEPGARAFLESPAYLEIARDREAGADTVALLVCGLG